MNTPLGLALLRDKRVPLKSKLLALGAGVVELLQLPIESIVALVLPIIGAAGDLAIDGAEVSSVPSSSPHSLCRAWRKPKSSSR